jgi:hypothetical protein
MIRVSGLVAALAATALLAAPAIAQGEGPRTLSGAEIEAALSGATKISTRNSPSRFREFHARGGQVYGANSTRPNRDACWRVAGDQACYRYPSGEFCYDVKVEGGLYQFVLNGRVSHIAEVRRGDPLSLERFARRWTCN